MRKLPKLIILLLTGALLASCNGSELPFEELPADESGIDTPYTDYTVPVSKITFSEDEKSIVLNKGETHTYTYTLEPKRAESKGINWVSENKEIATIEDGKLTAVGGGKTVILAESPDDLFNSVKLNVEVVVPIVDFTLEDTINLGYAKNHKVNVTFDPVDTTQNKLTYESTNTNVATVSENGEITTLQQDGYTDIKVHSETLGIDKLLRVNVSEPHLTAITLDKSVNEVEVDHTLEMHASLTPADAYEQRYVYSLDEASIAAGLATISESGVLSAKEKGTVTVKCTSVALPSIYDEFVVTIYQTKADRIVVENIEVSNQLSTYQIDPLYVDAGGNPITPSRKNLTFAVTSGEDKISVSETGLVTFLKKGSAQVTVTDDQLSGSPSAVVNVTCTMVATAVTISGPKSVYIGDSIELTVASTPARDTLSDTNISVEATGGREAATVNDSQLDTQNKITVTGVAAGAITLVVTVGGVRSNPYTITVSNKPFLQNKAYLVGDRNYSDGTAQSGDSWENAGQAYEMEEMTPEEGMSAQFKAIGIYFTTDSLWKIRVNAADWLNFDDEEHGKYQTTEGAFATEPAQMVVDINEQGYKNVKAAVAGYYDIYYKRYVENDYWMVYIEKTPTLSLSASDIYVVKDDHVDIEAHHYTGGLNIVSASTAIATAAQQGSTNVIRVNGVAKGDTTITVTDGLSNYATCTVHVRNRTFEDDKAYICGERDYSSGTSTAGSSWSDADQAFYMSTDISSEYEDEEYAWRGEVTFAENDIFKVRYGQVFKDKECSGGRYNLEVGAFASHDMGFTGEEQNVIVNTAGTYYVDYIFWNNSSSAEGWYEVRIYKKPVLTLDQDNVAIDLDGTGYVIVTASNVTGTLTASSDDTGVATVTTPTANTIKITGVAAGTATVTVGDSSTTVLEVAVTVAASIDRSFHANTIYVVGNKDFHGGESQSGASWSDSTKAYNIGAQQDDKDQDAFIKFASADEWKVRVGDDFMGDYYLCDGMTREGDGNVTVSTPGWYRVIFHNNTSESHRYVTVCQFSIDKTEMTISNGNYGKLSCYNYKAPLSVVSNNTSIATVSVTDNVATITGASVGNTTLTVSDATGKSFTVDIEITNTMDIYFTRPSSGYDDAWHDTIQLHYWGGASASTWPGVNMEFAYINEHNESVYVARIPTDATKIIFSCLKEGAYRDQTIDIVSGVGNNKGFYLTGGSWGARTVGSWDVTLP